LQSQNRGVVVLGIVFREIFRGEGVEKKSYKTFGGNKKIYDLCSPKTGIGYKFQIIDQ
jgi:hypothetical protein